MNKLLVCFAILEDIVFNVIKGIIEVEKVKTKETKVKKNIVTSNMVL